MVGACRPPTAEMGLMNVTTQPRVYFANRDPVREALQAWRQGTYPGQHLWGTTALEAAGYEVVDRSLAADTRLWSDSPPAG